MNDPNHYDGILLSVDLTDAELGNKYTVLLKKIINEIICLNSSGGKKKSKSKKMKKSKSKKSKSKKSKSKKSKSKKMKKSKSKKMKVIYII